MKVNCSFTCITCIYLKKEKKTALLSFMGTVYNPQWFSKSLIFYVLNREEFESEEDQVADIHEQLCKFSFSTQ